MADVNRDDSSPHPGRQVSGAGQQCSRTVASKVCPNSLRTPWYEVTVWTRAVVHLAKAEDLVFI